MQQRKKKYWRRKTIPSYKGETEKSTLRLVLSCSRNICFFVILCCFLYNNSIAQNNKKEYIDSLKNVIAHTKDDKAKVECYLLWDDEIYWEDPELDFRLHQKMMRICERKVKAGDTSHDHFFYEKLAKIYNQIAFYYEEKGDTESGLMYLNKGKKISEKLNDHIGIAEAYVNLGILYTRKNRPLIGIKYYSDAKPYAELKVPDTLNAEDFRLMQNYIESTIAFTYHNVYLKSSGVKKAQYLDSVLVYYDLAIDQCKALIKNASTSVVSDRVSSTLVALYRDLGSISLASGNYNQMLKYNKNALGIAKEIDHPGLVSSLLDQKAEYYFKTGNIRKAIELGVESSKIAKEINDLAAISNNARLLSTVYKANRQYDLALKNFEKYVTTRDSLNNLSNEKALIQNEYRQKYEKKSLRDSLNFVNEKRLKDVVIEKQEMKLGKERNQKILLIIFTILLFLIVLLVFRGLQQKKSANQIISAEKRKVEKHRKNMVDSITYAQKIQNEMLPRLDEIRNHFHYVESLSLPKDIVSGDFFWCHHEDGVSYLALADCTGHGVPGAFMSIIGANLLKEILLKKKNIALDKLLSDLDDGLISLLHQHDDTAAADGMEIGIVKINHQTESAEFAGANQNLYMVTENGTSVIKGELRSLGGWVRKRSRLPDFTVKTIPIDGVKAIYMATDGLEDQLGGPDNRKFGRDTFVSMIEKMDDSPDMGIINEGFMSWKGDKEQLDDIFVMCFKL